jgi:hypothetical protein
MTPTHIILHHSFTADSKTVSWGAIKKYHTKELGWADIGYHFGIELINDDYQILMGRMPGKYGAHCKEFAMNSTSIGVCFIGNFDVRTPNSMLWEKGLELVRWLKEIYQIPLEHIQGHKDYATYKTCPGLLFDMDNFRSDL